MFSKSFTDTIKTVLNESKEELSASDHLASWGAGGDIINQVASHSQSHNYKHGSKHLVVKDEEMRGAAIKHLGAMQEKQTDPVHHSDLGDRIRDVRNAKLSPETFIPKH